MSRSGVGHRPSMETPLTVIEAYLPGANDRDPRSYGHLLAHVRAVLGPLGLDASLLVLPVDETVLWLVKPLVPAPGHGSRSTDVDVPAVLAAATRLEAGHLIARHLDGRLVESDP